MLAILALASKLGQGVSLMLVNGYGESFTWRSTVE